MDFPGSENSSISKLPDLVSLSLITVKLTSMVLKKIIKIFAFSQPLANFFSYLNSKTLLTARLVCRRWDSVALSFFPEKVCVSPRRLEGQRIPETIDVLKTFNPNIFRCIRYNDVAQSREWRYNNKLILAKFLSCLKYIGANENINYIFFCGAAELESLATGKRILGLVSVVLYDKFIHENNSLHSSYKLPRITKP